MHPNHDPAMSVKLGRRYLSGHMARCGCRPFPTYARTFAVADWPQVVEETRCSECDRLLSVNGQAPSAVEARRSA